MEFRNQTQILAILDRAPRSNLRMYEALEYSNKHTEFETHIYVNKSAILFVTWSLMLWAEKARDLVPLLKYIPSDASNMELFCIEKRLVPC